MAFFIFGLIIFIIVNFEFVTKDIDIWNYLIWAQKVTIYFLFNRRYPLWGVFNAEKIFIIKGIYLKYFIKYKIHYFCIIYVIFFLILFFLKKISIFVIGFVLIFSMFKIYFEFIYIYTDGLEVRMMFFPPIFFPLKVRMTYQNGCRNSTKILPFSPYYVGKCG